MADPNFTRYLSGGSSQAFNPFGAGNKVYGSGRSAPNVGPVANREGYEERDRVAKLRRNALLKRLQAGQRGRYMSSDYLSPASRTR